MKLNKSFIKSFFKKNKRVEINNDLFFVKNGNMVELRSEKEVFDFWFGDEFFDKKVWEREF